MANSMNIKSTGTSSQTKWKRLLRILCIHGYRQNAQIFRERTGSFRKLTKNVAELVYVSAPNLITGAEKNDAGGDNTTADNEAGERGWWFSREDNQFHATEPTDCSKGFAESLTELKRVFHEKFTAAISAPNGFSKFFDGGFMLQGPFDGILGFSQGATMAALLCIVTETEQDMSQELMAACLQPTAIRHTGGHFIPTSPPQKVTYLQFLNEMSETIADAS